jgi:hypothetical protein
MTKYKKLKKLFFVIVFSISSNGFNQIISKKAKNNNLNLIEIQKNLLKKKN